MTPAPASGAPVAPSVTRLTPLGQGEVRIVGGFWHDRQQLNADVVLEHCRVWMERIGWIGNFDRAADGTVAAQRAGVEFVDSEVYKLLEAMAWELGRSPSAALEARYTDLVARVAAAQEADGYLHTAFGRDGQRPRFSDLRWGHELYCFGHLFQAAVARLRTGHDDLLPQVARRLAEHVWQEFGPEGRPGICGHPEIEMGLVELGRATGEPRWIELARLLVERRGHRTFEDTLFQGSDYFLDETPVRQATVLRGHAVRAVYLAAGAVDVAVETGDAELLAAVERQWATTAARRTYITGGIGAHHQNEAFGDDFELPADRAYAETCAAIGSVMLGWRLLLATGDERYADLAERTLLNAFLVGPRQDGRAFFYSNTLHQRHPGVEPGDGLAAQAESSLRASWFEVSCCPTNVARTLAEVGGYVATRDAEGVQLHQFADVDLATALDDGSAVRLAMRTGYPFDGTVRVRVERDAEFTLTLRIPSWARGATATIGGEPLPLPVEGRTLAVRRAFRAGDEVVLELPMAARVVTADPRVDAVRGAIAVERGPLVLCLESVDVPPEQPFDLLAFTGDVATTAQGATAAFTTLGAAERAWPFDADAADGGDSGAQLTLPLRPYAAWGNRGPAAMRVWLPVAPA